MKNLLKGKNIVLGITGSIAAYKAPLLIRELVKLGAGVKVVMTKAATEFVTPLVLKNLSQNPVSIEMFEEATQEGGAWHIQLAHWCDLMIIAPCSATTLSKLASGLCDNALVTVATALPRQTPLLIAPAMDSTMFNHPATQRNIRTLGLDGDIIIPPDEGQLSSGLVGPGRLPDIPVLMDYIKNSLKNNPARPVSNETKPQSGQSARNEADTPMVGQEILNAVEKSVFTLQDAIDKDKWAADLELTKMKHQAAGGQAVDLYLKGRRVLITAGPTIEKIDDVRYISNHSTGKMGYALAAEAIRAGAEVTLVSGPVSLPAPEGATLIAVRTAGEMFDAAVAEFEKSDLAVLSAAVADYTPVSPADGKIKKEEAGGNLTLELKATKDILAHLGSHKREGQVVAGFALESSNEIENGWKKLKSKNCDMIVVNSANRPKSGFGGDENTITLLTRDGIEESFPPMSKEMCAAVILKKAAEL